MSSTPPPSQDTFPDQSLRNLLSATTTLLVLAGFGWLIAYFYSLTALLGIVMIITYILLGPVNLMEKGIVAFSRACFRLKGYRQLIGRSPEANPRILAVLIVYFIFFMSLVLGGVRFLPVLGNQLGEMGQKVGSQLVDASDEAIDWVDGKLGQGTLRNVFAKDIRQAERQGRVRSHMDAGKPVTEEEKQVIQQSVIEKTLDQLEKAVESALPNFITLVGGTVNGFIYFLAGLALTFYFLIDGPNIKHEILTVVPGRERPITDRLLDSFHQVMFSFVKGQVMLGLLTGFYMFIIYSIFGVPYAALLGFIFAMAELLPVVGTWIGMSVGILVILLNMDPMTALWVWLCSYAYQTIKDNILTPKVVGDVMGLHPLVIVLALLICSKIAGVVGILMALPLASAINVILRLLLQKDAEEKAALEMAGPDYA